MFNVPDRDMRQRDIVPPDALAQCKATVVGVGAIGRQVALQLAAMGIPWLQLIDPDTVEPVNLACQGYLEDDLDRPKVQATADLSQQINHQLEAHTLKERYRKSMRIGNTLFCAVDSIDARKFIWESVKDKVRFFADGRMSAEVIRVLAVADEASRKHYPTTLFGADEAVAGPCTAKSTIFTANIAAGLMLEQFSRWLRRIPVDPDITLNLLAGEWTVASLRDEAPPNNRSIGHPEAPVSLWRCEKCRQSARMTFAEIAGVGMPICPDCGDDMELVSPL